MKVSLYLQDDVWKKFKRSVVLKTGELRNLSSQVQELIEESSVEDSVKKGFALMKIDAKPISSSKVVSVRPSVRTSSSATLRKMREHRFGGKDLPRQ